MGTRGAGAAISQGEQAPGWPCTQQARTRSQGETPPVALVCRGFPEGSEPWLGSRFQSWGPAAHSLLVLYGSEAKPCGRS